MNTNQANVWLQATATTLSVTSPYLTSWVDTARQLGGKWNASTSTWDFPISLKSDVQASLMRIYGEDGATNQEYSDIELHFDSMAYADQKPYVFAGREIAKASGRDSGARLGTHKVSLLSGRVRSGGSVKNWDTRIEADTVILLRDVPQAMIDTILSSENPRVIVREKAPPAMPITASTPTAEEIDAYHEAKALIAEFETLYGKQ